MSTIKMKQLFIFKADAKFNNTNNVIRLPQLS